MYLYVIQDTIYYKIGITDNWKKRLSSIQTGNPHPIIIRALHYYDHYPKQAVIDLEKRLHYQLRRYLHRGEWYILPEQTVSLLVNSSAEKIMRNEIAF